jgi:hypothetical protein
VTAATDEPGFGDPGQLAVDLTLRQGPEVADRLADGWVTRSLQALLTIRNVLHHRDE